MTRKHFIQLADTIRSDGSFSSDQINTLADFCAAQNPNFERNRWLAYIAGGSK